MIGPAVLPSSPAAIAEYFRRRRRTIAEFSPGDILHNERLWVIETCGLPESALDPGPIITREQAARLDDKRPSDDGDPHDGAPPPGLTCPVSDLAPFAFDQQHLAGQLDDGRDRDPAFAALGPDLTLLVMRDGRHAQPERGR